MTEQPFRVIAHINMRGGIGKTTATVSLAARAAQFGVKTCILDLDSQASASLAFNVIPEDDDAVFYDVWQDPVTMVEGSLQRISENLLLLPSSLQNGLLDSSLANPGSQKNAVRNVCDVIEALGVRLVVIDCPPSLGAAVISSICAADTIVVPTGADVFSFKGVEMTIREIRSIRDTFGLPLPKIRVLYSRFDRRETVSVAALDKLRLEYGDYFLPTVIRTSTEFNKALGRKETVFAWKGISRAKEDFDAYAREILDLPKDSLPADARRPNADIMRVARIPNRKKQPIVFPDHAVASIPPIGVELTDEQMDGDAS